MSFGLRDQDWVDPDEDDTPRCGDGCPEWEQCPCGCPWGVCLAFDTYKHEGDPCEQIEEDC